MSVTDWPLDLIDYGARCQCPSMWMGVTPPPCPVHNSSTGMTWTGTSTLSQSSPAPVLALPSISDTDIERIAKRVAEMLKGKG